MAGVPTTTRSPVRSTWTRYRERPSTNGIATSRQAAAAAPARTNSLQPVHQPSPASTGAATSTVHPATVTTPERAGTEERSATVLRRRHVGQGAQHHVPGGGPGELGLRVQHQPV